VLRHWFLAASAAFTLAVATPDLALAQHGRGGSRGSHGGFHPSSGHGGFHPGPSHGGSHPSFGHSGFHPSFSHSGFHPTFGHGGFHPGTGHAFHNPGFGHTIHHPGFGWHHSPGFAWHHRPPIFVRPPIVISSGDYVPEPTVVTAASPAEIDVRVPADDAAVWFEGVQTAQTGDYRTFESPPLDPGQTYTYDVRASWYEDGQAVDQTRQVQVSAGQHVMVDFASPQS